MCETGDDQKQNQLRDDKKQLRRSWKVLIKAIRRRWRGQNGTDVHRLLQPLFIKGERFSKKTISSESENERGRPPRYQFWRTREITKRNKRRSFQRGSGVRKCSSLLGKGVEGSSEHLNEFESASDSSVLIYIPRRDKRASEGSSSRTGLCVLDQLPLTTQKPIDTIFNRGKKRQLVRVCVHVCGYCDPRLLGWRGESATG